MKRILLPLLLCATAHAGPFDPARVSADAKWWLHADLAAARNTEIGKRVVATIDDKKGAQLRAIKRMFSINPLTDLRGISLFGDGRKDHAVAVIEGDFNRGHLEDLVKAAEDYKSRDREGTTIHSWTDKEKRQHAAFVRDDLLVFSHFNDLLEEALDTLGKGGGMAEDPFVSAGSGAPFLVGSANLSECEKPADGSQLVSKADALKLAIAEAGGRMEARMLLEVPDRADGERFRKVMEGIVALGELGNAQLDAADMKFEARAENGGRTVRCALSLPSADMLTMMEKNGAFDRIGE